MAVGTSASAKSVKVPARPQAETHGARPEYNPDYYKDRGEWKSDDSRLLLTGAVVLLMSMLFSIACAVCFFSIGRLDVHWPPPLGSVVPMPMSMAVQEVNISGPSAEFSSPATGQQSDSGLGAKTAASASSVGTVDDKLETVVSDAGPH